MYFKRCDSSSSSISGEPKKNERKRANQSGKKPPTMFSETLKNQLDSNCFVVSLLISILLQISSKKIKIIGNFFYFFS